MNEDRLTAIFESVVGRLEISLAASGHTPSARSAAIRDAVVEALHDPRATAGHLVERIIECVAASVQAVCAGGGRVRDAARGAMLGILHGTIDEHIWVTDTIEHVAAALVRHAIEFHDDVVEVSRAAIDAAKEAAGDLGVSAEEAAVAAARGAIRTAEEHGPEFQGVLNADVRAQLPETTYHLVTVRAANGGNGRR